MQKRIALLLLLFGMTTAAIADCIQDQYGEVLCGAGPCIKDSYGKVFCAPLDGGAMKDDHGTVVCGTGDCTRDRSGKIWCSTAPQGGASTDTYGKPKCYKGCEAATAERCEPGQ